MWTISNVGPLTWDHFQRGTINVGPFPTLVVSDPARGVSTETGLDPAGPTLSHDFSDFSTLGGAHPFGKIGINSWLTTRSRFIGFFIFPSVFLPITNSYFHRRH